MQIQSFKNSIPTLSEVQRTYAKQNTVMAEKSRHSRQSSHAVQKLNKPRPTSKNQPNGTLAYIYSKVGNSVERMYENLPTSMQK